MESIGGEAMHLKLQVGSSAARVAASSAVGGAGLVRLSQSGRCAASLFRPRLRRGDRERACLYWERSDSLYRPTTSLNSTTATSSASPSVWFDLLLHAHPTHAV